MRAFVRVLWLELVGFVRTKTAAMLLVASVGWMYAFPHLVRGDGTPDGLRELYVRYSLGGVFALLSVALLASATGSLARERAARRLQLTLVRPVRYPAVVLAKIAAHVLVGAVVLAVAAAVLATKVDVSRRCSHVLKPTLPTAREEAKVMYEAYMASSNTPLQVRQSPKKDVLRLLEIKAADRYVTLPTNSVARWKFGALGNYENLSDLTVRLRFATQFDSRHDVDGVFRLGEATGVVSNLTKAVLTIPLLGAAGEARQLSFENRGRGALMLRPRKDLDLLVPADGFGWNLVRAYLVQVSVLALLISFGLFLSASLGRPVALFVAIVMLILSEMSPSVVDQYDYELDMCLSDRIGLALTRVSAVVTHPVASLDPLERLASDECMEKSDVACALGCNLVLVPIVFALLAGFVLPRKHED